jgi:hypothetical protein
MEHHTASAKLQLGRALVDGGDRVGADGLVQPRILEGVLRLRRRLDRPRGPRDRVPAGGADGRGRVRATEPAGRRRGRQRVAEADGSLEAATALRLRADPRVSDLLFIDPDTSSNDSAIVSVRATASAWTGAARADTGDCFWVRIEAAGGTIYGTGTDCSAEEASEAAPGAWPEP